MAKQKQEGLLKNFEVFRTGLITNRNPLATVYSNPGTMYQVAHEDALIDGLNVELTPQLTIKRRPGMPNYCSSAFGSSEWPLNFWSGILNGTLFNIVDTQTTLYSFGPGSKSSQFTKGGTGQTWFQQVGNTLFFVNGTDNRRWSGVLGEGWVANGIPAPTKALTIPNLNLFDTVGTTQTLHAWVPSAAYTNSTAAAIVLYLIDPNGNIQWSVLAAHSSAASQAAAPNWATAYAAQTTDGTMVWTCGGPTGSWAASTVYANAAYTTTHRQNQTALLSAAGSIADTGGGSFVSTIGSSSVGWNPNTGTTGDSSVVQFQTLGLAVPTNATIKGIQFNCHRGSNRANVWSDKIVQLLKAGSAAGNNKAAAGFWPQTMWNQYTIPQTGGYLTVYGGPTDLWGTTWTVAQINAAGFGIQLQAHLASTSTSTAAYTYNGLLPNTPLEIIVYYQIGASDITGSVYAQVIIDPVTGTLQGVKTGGTSGGSVPGSFSATIGGTTTDNTVTWQCLGTAAQLSALFSWTWAYSYHTTGATNHTSTMSPLLTAYAPMVGDFVPLLGYGSDEVPCDRIDIYRTPDGGSLLLADTGAAGAGSAPNVNSATSFTVNDACLDINLDPGTVGPIAHLNDPPPAGGTIICSHMGRLWMLVGNLLYFSAGPDCTNGDGYQAWPPANVFAMPSGGRGLHSTTAGLVVVCQEELQIILGGPQTLSFYPWPLMAGVGCLSPNCSVKDRDALYLFTNTSQLIRLDLTNGETEPGFDVADLLLANFPPASSYIAIHRNGQDEGLFISDGVSKIQRMSLKTMRWSPVATITGGCAAIKSVQTALGVYTLLAGAAAGSLKILGRTPGTYHDQASGTYSGYATIGPIILSMMGAADLAAVQSIVVGCALVGTPPTVSVLPNEISGSFTSIPYSTEDPWRLGQAATVDRDRYDWLGVQSTLPNGMRTLQIKLGLAAEDAASEVYSLALVPPPANV